jgi:integrase
MPLVDREAQRWRTGNPSRRGVTYVPIEPRNLNHFFDELIHQARVRRVRFPDLRHTCASLLLAQNVPARVVMEILGHSQLAMSTDLYSHVMPTALRAAADAMDRVLVQPN